MQANVRVVGSEISQFQHIMLTEQDKRGQVWVEGTASEAKWTFERATADTLVGQWTDAQGQRSLPIHLQRVASPKGAKTVRAASASGPAADDGLADSSDTDSATCGTLNAAFNAPRVAAQKMAQTDGVFETHRYSRVSLLNGAVEGFALPDPATQPRLSQAPSRPKRPRNDWLPRASRWPTTTTTSTSPSTTAKRCSTSSGGCHPLCISRSTCTGCSAAAVTRWTCCVSSPARSNWCT